MPSPASIEPSLSIAPNIAPFGTWHWAVLHPDGSVLHTSRNRLNSLHAAIDDANLSGAPLLLFEIDRFRAQRREAAAAADAAARQRQREILQSLTDLKSDVDAHLAANAQEQALGTRRLPPVVAGSDSEVSHV